MNESQYRIMETRTEAAHAIDEVVQLARRELAIFAASPAALAVWDFNRPARCELLRALLLGNRERRVRLALHDTAGIERELPRLLTLLAQFSTQLLIHQTLGVAREAKDSLVIADQIHFWRKLHEDHPRSVLSLHASPEAKPLVERFSEIWDSSALAVHGGTAGL